PPQSSQSSIHCAGRRRHSPPSSRGTRARFAGTSRGEPANADGDMYGEPVIPSGGPSGSTCHQRWPAAASQSTKRNACSSSTPLGNEVGCSRMPEERLSFIVFENLTDYASPQDSRSTVAHPDSGGRAD